MDIHDLRERVDQKTHAVRALEELLEKEESELIELERQLEMVEDQEECYWP